MDFYRFDQEYYAAANRVERLKIRRLNKRRLVFRLFLVFALIGLGVYAGYSYGDRARDFLAWRIGATFAGGGSEKRPEALAKPADPVKNILIMGTDQRENEPSRSDTIIVAMLNLKTKKAHFISLPRDSRVKIEGFKHKTKLNHAHSNGGIKLVKSTVENLLGIRIHNYVETNFTGFANIIDLLGGVEIDVEQRMYYPPEDIDVKKGRQVLDGHDALGYVRYRSDGRGDLGRIERQQKFLKALIEQHLRLGTLLKLPDIIEQLKENVKTDMSVADLLSLAEKFHSMKAADVQFHQLPGEPDYMHGASYFIVDEEELQYLMREIEADLR